MAKIEVQLLDEHRCVATHPESGARLVTDISPEYGGGGTSFSSTDLIAVALATCIGSSLSPMALREGIPLEQIRIVIEKTFDTQPKRVSHLAVEVRVPSGLTPTQLTKLTNAARSCSVHRSLASPIDMTIDLLEEEG
ncbi:MAG: OsmC family protein [Thermoanaerobaculia bacterium]|nr:OsmC family protein [Thermoanaerobaculia bacterium]